MIGFVLQQTSEIPVKYLFKDKLGIGKMANRQKAWRLNILSVEAS